MMLTVFNLSKAKFYRFQKIAGLFLGGVAVVLLSGCASLSGTSNPVKLDVTTHGAWHQHDRVEWHSDGQQLVIDVFSPAGVGSARLQPVSGGWPEKVSLRLHLVALEGLIAATSADRFEYSLPGQENRERAEKRSQGADLKPIEVDLPGKLFENPEEPLVIQWIDFYR